MGRAFVTLNHLQVLSASKLKQVRIGADTVGLSSFPTSYMYSLRRVTCVSGQTYCRPFLAGYTTFTTTEKHSVLVARLVLHTKDADVHLTSHEGYEITAA